MGWRERNRPADLGPWRGILTGYWSGYKRSGGHYYRHMRTTQERRHWDSEYGRASRSPRKLPSWYDDIPRHTERSWKRHRRSQWKLR
jgi:hypothetical protein